MVSGGSQEQSGCKLQWEIVSRGEASLVEREGRVAATESRFKHIHPPSSLSISLLHPRGTLLLTSFSLPPFLFVVVHDTQRLETVLLHPVVALAYPPINRSGPLPLDQQPIYPTTATTTISTLLSEPSTRKDAYRCKHSRPAFTRCRCTSKIRSRFPVRPPPPPTTMP